MKERQRWRYWQWWGDVNAHDGVGYQGHGKAGGGGRWWEVVVAVAEMEMMVSGDGGGKGGELMSVAATLSDAD